MLNVTSGRGTLSLEYKELRRVMNEFRARTASKMLEEVNGNVRG